MWMSRRQLEKLWIEIALISRLEFMSFCQHINIRAEYKTVIEGLIVWG